MSNDAIHQLEQLLGQRLPENYLLAMKDYPDSLTRACRSIDDSEMEGFVSEVEFVRDFECVLYLNVETRSDSVQEPGGLEFFWPEQFLVIGETGGGDYYCVDVEGEVEGVMQFDHQAVQFDVVADSLQEFVEILEETFCDFEEPLTE